MSGTLPGLGRIFKPDPRDANYPLRALAPLAGTAPTERIWSARPALDQGRTPQCVGYTARQWLSSSPVPDPTGPDAPTIYHGAQLNDEWDGEGYDGSSDRGAMKYLQALGHVSAYHWAATAEEAAAYLLSTGTALIGVNWYDTMFTPGRDGYIRIGAGKPVGGHELLVVGYSTKRGAFRLLNSWGNWGERGRAWLAGEDLARLLAEDGDCCAPTQAVPTEMKP